MYEHNTCVCACLRLCVCVCACVRACVRACACARVCLCLFVCAYMFICVRAGMRVLMSNTIGRPTYIGLTAISVMFTQEVKFFLDELLSLLWCSLHIHP